MNPVVTPVKDDIVKFELTEEDLAYLKKIKLEQGDAGWTEIIMHRMCIMQAVAALTTEASKRQRLKEAVDGEDEPSTFTDHPICVSEAIADALIAQNDREDITDRQRASLKKIVPDILNTCPVKRTVKSYKTMPDRIIESRGKSPEYKAAEFRRLEILDRIELPGFTREHGVRIPVGGTPLPQALKIIREAAAVYHVDEEVHGEQ